MANYQELLSKAVKALPENNGAARREVYEKARKALVAQLRAINPPLPAREITQHRLELEDCIRQVEHEATEALLGGLKNVDETSIPLTREASQPQDAGSGGHQEDGAPVSAGAETPVVETVAAGSAGAERVEEKSIGGSSVVKEQPDGAEGAGPEQDQSGEPAGQEPGQNQEQTREEPSSAREPSEAVSENVGSGPGADQDREPEEGKNSALEEIIARAEKARNADDGTDVAADRAAELTAGKQESVREVSGVDTSAADELAAAVVAQANGGQANGGQADGEQADGGRVADDHKSPVARTESDKGVGAAMSRVREVDNIPVPAVSVGDEKAQTVADKGADEARSEEPVADFSANGVLGGVSDAPVSGKGEVLSGEEKSSARPLDMDEDEPQLVVDRAIQTLDRVARGEDPGAAEDTETDGGTGQGGDFLSDEARFSVVDEEEKGSSGLTVFLVVVILLFGIVGGGGYWAWKEGYVDLEALFTSGEAAGTPEQGEGAQDQVASGDAGATGANETSEEGTGPGNTTTDVESVDPTDPVVALEDPNRTDERLSPDASPIRDVTGDVVGQPDGDGVKIEERLGAEATIPDAALGQEGDSTVAAPGGSAQSLLLEAAADGANGAVPFSGTVEWSRGVDELGQPTLIGKANIPARNLSVQVLIRRNADSSLPASHLMEIDFDVSESFAGGAIAGLPGILLKNEELVQGTALIGASARVVGNSFLFALSASDQDVRANMDLLSTRRWMDLALIYASGRRAIITLEKDEAADALFRDVMAVWTAASNGAQEAGGEAGDEGGAAASAQDAQDNG